MANDGAERTERATPRRRSKERDKGNVVNSRDLSSALILTTGVALISIFSGYILNKMKSIMIFAFTNLNPKNISTSDIAAIFAPYVKSCADILVPLFLCLFIVGVFVIRMQIGKVFAIEKIKPKFSNISPKKMIDGFKRLFNIFDTRKMVEFAKSLLKLTIVGCTGFMVVKSRIDELYGILGADVQTGFMVIGSVLTQMIIDMCIAMIILGIFDRYYQDWEYEKSLKMTKQEVKDEMKDMDGDPKIKARIRAAGMKILQQKMMSAVPKADVVVTNPTHYAVALKYDKSIAPAPIVVAKGVDFIAFKIRDIAQENKVPIVENRAVARALYNLVPIDGIIPSDMFTAVAEILAMVYKNKQAK